MQTKGRLHTFCSRFPLVLAAENDDGDDFLPCCVVDFHNSLGHHHQDVSCNAAAFTSLFIDQTEALLLHKATFQPSSSTITIFTDVHIIMFVQIGFLYCRLELFLSKQNETFPSS